MHLSVLPMEGIDRFHSFTFLIYTYKFRNKKKITFIIIIIFLLSGFARDPRTSDRFPRDPRVPVDPRMAAKTNGKKNV